MNIWYLRSVVPVALMAVLGLAPNVAPGETGTPTASVSFVLGDNNVVSVPADTTTLTATGIGDLDKLGVGKVDELGKSLTIVDRGIARGSAASGSIFKFDEPEFVGRSGTDGLIWRVPVKVKMPMDTSEVRVAKLSFGTADPRTYALEFTVSATRPAASQWTAHGATDIWTVSWSDKPDTRVYGITIENPDKPITNVRLAQSTLRDTVGHAIGIDRLRLVDHPNGDQQAALDVPGNSTRTVFLRLEAGESNGPFGTFEGAVRLTADGSPSMKDVSVKVQASSNGRRWWGVGLMFAGLFLTILLAAVARPLMARMQAQRAAAALSQGIEQFDDELNRTMPSDIGMPGMKGEAQRLKVSISDTELKRANLLPPLIAIGPGFEAIPDTTAALKTRLDGVSNALEGLLVLLRNGAPPILKLLKIPAKQDAARGFASELDTLASAVTNRQDAKTKVDALTARVLAARGAELAAAEPSSIRAVTVSDLDFRIGGLSLLAWSIWGLIALVIGTAWIFNDADFGTTLDLASSFAWGFGMTTFGGGIQTLQPTSVATAMNVKIPK
jgi:hypothetical protein